MAKKSTLDPKVTVVYQAFFDELFVKSIKKVVYYPPRGIAFPD
jgi:hypothetical protein